MVCLNTSNVVLKKYFYELAKDCIMHYKQSLNIELLWLKFTALMAEVPVAGCVFNDFFALRLLHFCYKMIPITKVPVQIRGQLLNNIFMWIFILNGHYQDNEPYLAQLLSHFMSKLQLIKETHTAIVIKGHVNLIFQALTH